MSHQDDEHDEMHLLDEAIDQTSTRKTTTLSSTSTFLLGLCVGLIICATLYFFSSDEDVLNAASVNLHRSSLEMVAAEKLKSNSQALQLKKAIELLGDRARELDVVSLSAVGTSFSLSPYTAPSSPAPRRQLTVWTSDLHNGCLADTSSTIQAQGQRVAIGSAKGRDNAYASLIYDIPNSTVFFPHEKRERHGAILHNDNVRSGLSEDDVRGFYEYYREDQVMKDVDAFYCEFIPSVCELYMPFNISIIWRPAHRVFIGRCGGDAQRKLVKHIRMMILGEGAPTNVKRAKHFLHASNEYDAEYLKYYTGLDAKVIASNSLFYTGDRTAWNPTSDIILYAPLQLDNIRAEHVPMLQQHVPSFKFDTAHNLYHRYTLDQIVQHKAVVVFPYAVISFGIVELYALNIPIFIPSVPFIVSLGIGVDRTVPDHHYCPGQSLDSMPPQHPDSKHPFSPDSNEREAQEYWQKFAFYYANPHITQFSSWEDLEVQLKKADFKAIHDAMVVENARRKKQISEQWNEVFDEIRADQGGAPHQQTWLPYQDQIKLLWGEDNIRG